LTSFPTSFPSQLPGYETTKGIAKRGATVYIGCKDPIKAQPAIQKIIQETGNSNIKALTLDLASLASVREFAEHFRSNDITIHVLLNNAGVWMGNEVSKTVDGFESTFGVNHLGHFLLTNLLVDLLKKETPSRIVTVSSKLHERGILDFENLNSEKSYDPMQAYSNSKLMNVLFSNELARRLAGTGVVTSSLHPGVISTGLHRSLENPVIIFIYENIWGFLGKSPEFGAQTSITAAISPKLLDKTGVYLSECQVVEPLPVSKNEKLAKEFWELSEKLVGLNKN
jgi:NAD(P)-dependent dehydrogenase (short-subunit alcohol dehydrogenase family)